MNAQLNYKLNGAIATISMDDGKANVMSLQMLSDLNEALDRATEDRATVVLTGRARMFSAGFDLPLLNAGGPEATKMMIAGLELVERVLSFPTPVVVACNGHALAMGAFLMLAADYRIAVDGAFKIGTNETAIGLTMPYLGIEICRQRLTPAHFNRAVIMAEIYTPVDAVTAGFVDRVVPAAQLEEETARTAARLAELDMKSFAATKLRARDASLKQIRSAIEKDTAIFEARG